MSDLDRYLAHNRPSWDRLSQLTKQVQSRPGTLQPLEVDEFLRLYQRVSSQLSFARHHYKDPSLTAELNQLTADANAALYRRTASPAAGLRRFFVISFPAAVWKLRRAVATAALITFLPAAIMAIWFAQSPAALDAAAPEALRAAYVEEDFEAYYSSEPAGQFATKVLVNNIQVSFLAFALGVFCCVGTVYVLAYNGANIGMALGVFAAAGQQPKFWGLILPHGLLELSAVVIAGAAGLSMGWAIIAPGDRTRSGAFTEEARRSVAVVLGLVLAFIVAGIIEGFVTPGLPTVPRIAVGVVVETAFVVYIVSFGRRAEARGLTGLASEELEGESARAALRI